MKKQYTPDDLKFYDATHSYYMEGKELTSVTYALQSCGILDYSGVHWELLERAKLIGDIVHEIAHMYALGTLDESTVDINLGGYLEAIKKYFRENVKEVISVESKVFDLNFQYAGRTDIAYIGHDMRKNIDDYKTGVAIPLAARLQTAAYQKAFEKNYNIKIPGRGAVYLNHDGTYTRTKFTNRQDFHEFIKCVGIARLKDSYQIK